MAIAVTRTRLPGGRHVAEAALLSDQEATTDGEWIPISGVRPFTVHVTGIDSATVDLRASGAEEKPANNVAGEIVGSAKTANGMWNLDQATFKWLKCRVTVYASGTINAWFHGEQA